MKKLLGLITVLVITYSAFAGEVPMFVDLGFSEDGTKYAFAQYGVIDETLQAFAEVYILSVKDNDYVSGGIRKIEPSKETANVPAKKIYKDLMEQNSALLEHHGFADAKPATPIYRLAPGVAEQKIIEVRDFQVTDRPEEIRYQIHLKEKVEGINKNAISSFYLEIEQRDTQDVVLSRGSIGSSRLKEKGVTEYKIYRVLTDKSHGNLAVVVQRRISGKHGNSIRFGVETTRLGEF